MPGSRIGDEPCQLAPRSAQRVVGQFAGAQPPRHRRGVFSAARGRRQASCLVTVQRDAESSDRVVQGDGQRADAGLDAGRLAQRAAQHATMAGRSRGRSARNGGNPKVRPSEPLRDAGQPAPGRRGGRSGPLRAVAPAPVSAWAAEFAEPGPAAWPGIESRPGRLRTGACAACRPGCPTPSGPG